MAPTRRKSARMVHAAFDAGVNFFDTANAYVNGVSEAMLGKALKGRRSDAVIASKVFNPMGGRPNDSGMSRLHIKQAVEDSLRRLQTDYIDVYYIHHVDIQTPLEEMLRAFDDLVRQGKILYTACSNYEAWRLMEALWLSRLATAGRASRPTSRNTAWWCATSTRRSCRPAKPRGWASSPGRRSPRAISPASTSRATSRPTARARPRAGASRAVSSPGTMPRSCRRCSTRRATSTARRRRPRCAG